MRELRTQLNISLSTMAERVNYAKSHLSAVEQDKSRPSLKLLLRYEQVLQITDHRLEQQFIREVHPKTLPKTTKAVISPRQSTPQVLSKAYWGNAPDKLFLGREKEQTDIKTLLSDEQCRVVVILGVGGMGKTSLAAQIGHTIESSFEYIIWLSLELQLPFTAGMQRILNFVQVKGQHTQSSNPDEQMQIVLDYLRNYHCLLIIDNFETALADNDSIDQLPTSQQLTQLPALRYRPEYSKYGTLIDWMQVTTHKSRLLITSRVKIPESKRIEPSTTLRSYILGEMNMNDAQELISTTITTLNKSTIDSTKGSSTKQLIGTASEWELLVKQYSGNPTMLQMVASNIRDVFNFKIGDFLKANELIVADISIYLKGLSQELSEHERMILMWFAIETRVPTFSLLRAEVITMSERDITTALKLLVQRSMIDEGTEKETFRMLPAIRAFFLDELLQHFFTEITSSNPLAANTALARYPLIIFPAQEDAPNTDINIFHLAKRLCDMLRLQYTPIVIEAMCDRILNDLRSNSSLKMTEGYAAGNIINILRRLHISTQELTAKNFSQLFIRNAYLQGLHLHNCDFSGSEFKNTSFTETFGNILALAFTPEGDYLAAGTGRNEIVICQVSTGRIICTKEVHRDWVWSVAFSHDGMWLASGSADQTVQLWRVIWTADKQEILPETLENRPTIFERHTAWVRAVIFSSDNKTLLSGAEDATMYSYDIASRTEVTQLPIHQGYPILALASSPNAIIASADSNGGITVWRKVRNTYIIWKTLAGHDPIDQERDRVNTLAFTVDGKLLASGSHGGILKIWNVETGNEIVRLDSFRSAIIALAFNTEGTYLAVSSEDEDIQILVVTPTKYISPTTQLINTDATIYLGTGSQLRIGALAFHPHNGTLATGSDERSIRIWNIKNQKYLLSLQGYTNRIHTIAFNPQDNNEVASGSEDINLHIWPVRSDVATEPQQLVPSANQTLVGHSQLIWAVAFHNRHKLLASASEDTTIKLWHQEHQTAPWSLLQTYTGHKRWVRTVTFHPTLPILASAGGDKIIRFWHIANGSEQEIHAMQLSEHTDRIWSIAFSPDGHYLASASADTTIRVWSLATHAQTGQLHHKPQLVKTIKGHTSWVKSVAFNADGTLLASGSEDKTIRFWDVHADFMELEARRIQTERIQKIVFSPNGAYLASGSDSRKINLYTIASGGTEPIAMRQSFGWAIAFNAENSLLATGNIDGTIIFYTVPDLQLLTNLTIYGNRPYEGTIISNVQGLSVPQRQTLIALGARDKVKM